MFTLPDPRKWCKLLSPTPTEKPRSIALWELFIIRFLTTFCQKFFQRRDGDGGPAGLAVCLPDRLLLYLSPGPLTHASFPLRDQLFLIMSLATVVIHAYLPTPNVPWPSSSAWRPALASPNVSYICLVSPNIIFITFHFLYLVLWPSRRLIPFRLQPTSSAKSDFAEPILLLPIYFLFSLFQLRFKMQWTSSVNNLLKYSPLQSTYTSCLSLFIQHT